MERDGVVPLYGGPRRPGIAGTLAAHRPGRHGPGGQYGGTLRTSGGDVVPALWSSGSLAGIGMEAVRPRNECARASKLVGLVRDGSWHCLWQNHAGVGMVTPIGPRYPYRLAESQPENRRKRGMMP